MQTNFDRQTDISYSPLVRLDTRAGTSGPLTDPAILERIKSQALDASVFDQYPPYAWRGEISSSRWDSFDTRMGASTLRNYGEEAQAGVAFLRNHNSADDAVGATYWGRFYGPQHDGVARVEAGFFALTDPATEPYLAKIRAGVVRDLSVGFFGGEWICSLCQRDMQQFFGSDTDTCAHLLGMVYTPTDEAGTVKGPPETARATIENAHLAEVSGVYDGSTPGAMIGKARALAVEGQLNERSSRLVEQRYRVLLPPPTRRWAGGAPSATSPAAEQPQPAAAQRVPWDRWPRATTIAEVPAWARDLVHRGA